MTRILFWNIQKFTSNTIARKDPFNVANDLTLDYITQTINNKTHGPDIFALIELPGGPGSVQGELVTNGIGYEGIKILQEHLGADWDLVPPIATGEGKKGAKREGIAVFFKHNVVSFQGPWFFNPREGKTQPQKDNRIVHGPIRTGYQGTHWYNPKSTVGEYGGQWNFKDGGKDIEFPIKGERRPWRTLFKENQGAKRFLDVISFHAAYGGGPVKSVQALEQVIKGLEVVKDDYVRIIGGDFNVDANNNNKRPKAYKHLIDAGFNGEFLTPFSLTIKGERRFRQVERYCKTSINLPEDAKVSNGDYPYYEYACRCYDHIFTQYAKGKRPLTTFPMVLNPITGVDFGNAGTPPNKNSRKGYGYAANPSPFSRRYQNVSYPSTMMNSVEAIFGLAQKNSNLNNRLGIPFDENSYKDNLFRQLYNYGHIRRTSDHMGVIVDV